MANSNTPNSKRIRAKNAEIYNKKFVKRLVLSFNMKYEEELFNFFMSINGESPSAKVKTLLKMLMEMNNKDV